MIVGNKFIRFLITLLIALAGGTVFELIHVPIPWLLGPMSAILIGSRCSKMPLYWPIMLRDTGLMFIGYSIGLSFTKAAILGMIQQLPMMFLMTVLTLSICAGMAFIVSKLSGVNYPTILTGSIPGGLSQMIYFAEETKGIDPTTVTFLQVIRLLMIIFFIPILIFSPLFGEDSGSVNSAGMEEAAEAWGDLFPTIIIFAVVSIFLTFLGKKINSPTPFMLGPILGTAIINLLWISGPVLPPSIIDASQLLIGVYIGLLLNPKALQHKGKMIWLGILNSGFLVLSSLALSFGLIHIYDISAATSFLSLAPGGMDQMGIIAHEIKADLSVVSGFQMFRLLFIYFAVPPMLTWVIKYRRKKNREVDL